jgi:AmmeMemoRadiSam system protein A
MIGGGSRVSERRVDRMASQEAGQGGGFFPGGRKGTMEETTAKRGASLATGEREELLRIARNAVIACVSGGKMPQAPPAHSKLAAPGAAFVTLRSGGHLRGCIGYTEPRAPLYRVVQECAVAAATEDPRFPRVTKEEVDDLRIEISVLTSLSPIRPEDVTVGVHGLQIRKGMNRGLLLPQVAVEHGWDRQMFLSQVCRKAGLLPDAWKEDAELYSFTAEVFEE